MKYQSKIYDTRLHIYKVKNLEFHNQFHSPIYFIGYDSGYGRRSCARDRGYKQGRPPALRTPRICQGQEIVSILSQRRGCSQIKTLVEINNELFRIQMSQIVK